MDDLLARGLRLHRAGDHRRASEIYRKILRRRPAHPDALHLLGLATQRLGRTARARQLIAKAVAAAPDNATYRHSLGVLLREQGRTEEAVASFHAALDLAPDAAMTWTALGNALKALGRFEEALAAHDRALALAPDSVEILSNLALTHKAAGRPAHAVEGLSRAVALSPGDPDLHYNLGNAWLAAGAPAEAESAFRRALALRADDPRVLSNLGVALREQGRTELAGKSLRAAVATAPGFAEAHWNLALALLMEGRFEEGWREYEWRRRIPGFAVRDPAGPGWDGAALGDGTLLVHAEQGLGDAIQFARYLRPARARAGRVVLECPAPLARLLAGIDGADAVVARGAAPPEFAAHAPLMSLPGLLDPDLAGAGALVPYLAAEPGLVARWRRRLAGLPGLRVGLCWQGNPAYGADARRSIPLEAFAPLAALEGVSLVSLQKGDGEDQIESFSGRARLVMPAGPEGLDSGGDAFVDTAAVIAGLDLVVTSDTALAHLAGAMGAEVWLLLAAVPDWRWGLSGETTPWYPSMRLFRQARAGDWAEVMARVGRALAARLQ